MTPATRRKSSRLWLVATTLLLGGCDDGGTPRCVDDPCPRFTFCGEADAPCQIIETIDAAATAFSPKLALAPDGRVYGAALSVDRRRVLFGVYAPDQERIRYQVAASGLELADELALAVFADGRPALIVSDEASDHLKFILWDDERAAWRIENIDQIRADDLDLFIDSDDIPHISYRDRDNQRLRYAQRRDRVWQIENVDLARDAERLSEDELCPDAQRSIVNRGVGYGSHIVVQGTTPIISYHDGDCGSLRVARRGAERQWTVSVLDGWSATSYVGATRPPQTTIGRWSDMALSPLGEQVVTYFDATSGVLRAADLSGVSALVDDGIRTSESEATRKHFVGQMPAAAFDPDGGLVIAHYDGTRRRLLVSSRDVEGGSWVTESFDSIEGFAPSIVIDDDGTVYVASTTTSARNRSVDLLVLERGLGADP